MLTQTSAATVAASRKAALPGLGAQESPQRRLEVARPRGPAREPCLLSFAHGAILAARRGRASPVAAWSSASGLRRSPEHGDGEGRAEALPSSEPLLPSLRRRDQVLAGNDDLVGRRLALDCLVDRDRVRGDVAVLVERDRAEDAVRDAEALNSCVATPARVPSDFAIACSITSAPERRRRSTGRPLRRPRLRERLDERLAGRRELRVRQPCDRDVHAVGLAARLLDVAETGVKPSGARIAHVRGARDGCP